MSDKTKQTINVTSGMVTGFDSSAAVASQTLTITYSGKIANYNISIIKATPSGTPAYTAITQSGKTLADATLTVGSITPAGTIAWNSGADTPVVANTSYGWTFTPTDPANYNTLTGSITPYVVSNGGGGGGDGDGDGGTVTPPVKQPDTSESGDGGTVTPPVKQPDTSESGGWNEIHTELSETKPGETVVVNMNGATQVPKEIFEEIAGKDITVELKMDNGISWIINGEDIPEGASLSDLDFGVTIGGSTIPTTVINQVTSDSSTVQISLKYDGAFGLPMTLIVPLGTESNGLWANLYYYNEILKRLEFKYAGLINDKGNASFILNHASEYAVVIDNESHDPEAKWENPFTDVKEDDWFYDNVRYVYENKLMFGTSATLFSSNITTTRGMIVTILYRLEKEPVVSGSNPFDDVSAGNYYENAITWAAANNIVAGYGNSKFGPDDPITREQMAAILYRYAKYKGYDVSKAAELTGFSDANSISDYAPIPMKWANAEGLIIGNAKTLGPVDSTLRSQVAAIIHRFCNSFVK